MTAGETLLKVSDYPFAYSFITLASAIFNYSITHNHLWIIGIAGALGTLLTFTDPIGHIIRWQQQFHFKRHPVTVELTRSGNVIDTKYLINSLNTRAIGIEIDRILGIIYFGISALMFILLLLNPHSFIKDMTFQDKDGIVQCESSCVKGWGLTGGVVALGLAIYFTYLRWIRDLSKKTRIAGIHQLAISDEFPTSNSVENMTKAVEQNDWVTAEEWGNKILEEINYKKGKKEIILKAGDRVYRQLHKEVQRVIDDFNRMRIIHSYSNCELSLWDEIRKDADDVIIEDVVLRLEIIGFYDKVEEYNATSQRVRSIVFNIIREKASLVYGKNITSIGCRVNTGGGVGDTDLPNCALFEIHPKNYMGSGNVVEIGISYSIENEKQQSEQIQDRKRLEEFDKIWEYVINEVHGERNVIKFKNLVSEIQKQAPPLLEKFKEKIALEWKL